MSKTKEKVGTPTGEANPEFYSGGRWRQYYSGSVINIGAFFIGNAWSWTATAIPSIKQSEELGELTPAEEAWITAIVFLSAVFGCVFSGFTMQRLGLRMSMLILTLPLVGGWVLIALAQSVLIVLAGRFVVGFSAGGIALAAPVFVAETSEPSIRGKIGFGYNAMASVGILYVFIVGAYVPWRWQALACTIIPIMFHILVLLIPDSPRSLIERGHEVQAAKSLAWFRCAESAKMVDHELTIIIESVELEKTRRATSHWKQYLSASTLKPTWIGVCLMFFFHANGAVAVLANTAEIFQAAGSSDKFLGTVLVGTAQLVFAVLAAFFVDRYGRKVLLILSEIFMAIPLIVFGIFFYLKLEVKLDEEVMVNWNWIPVASLMVFISAFSVGFGPVPWVLLGELVPPSAKGFSSAVVTITNRGIGFLVVFFFKYIIQWIGQYGCYWLFAGTCIAGAFYVHFCVPETKGKTLIEIQEYFNGAESTKKNSSTIN